ncbi:MAG: hypothetical protein LBC76_06535 [Treponema sp.]|jgi:hypothetical protein|nr:hypothetical protein [Treponema sp.]
MKIKKNIFSLIFIFILGLLLSACATVNSKGIYYFVGKSENDLIKYFGYNGKLVEPFDPEYDKVLFFTSKILKYQMSKTEYIRYKVTRQSEILNIMFNQFSDGCLTFINSAYYGNHYGIEGVGFSNQQPRVIHRNDNSAIRPVINNFNNIINRYDAFPNSQRDIAFDRSKIGDTYYLYSNTSKQYYNSGVTGLTPNESYTSCSYVVWRIDIVAEDRPETQKYIVVTYNDRFNRCYDGNNNIITVDRANEIIDYYTNNGFSSKVINDGLSMYAFIKNGKIVKLEEGK